MYQIIRWHNIILSTTIVQLKKMNDKETRILMLIANGYETGQISEIMHMSRHTVDGYRKKILAKMNANNMPHAVYNYMVAAAQLG